LRVVSSSARGPERCRDRDAPGGGGPGGIQPEFALYGKLSELPNRATSYYLAKQLGARGVKVTRIAHGLPAGSGLDFADDLTLTRALASRVPGPPPRTTTGTVTDTRRTTSEPSPPSRRRW
jgi:hypothetical protein